jgi:hypothetical protein
VLVAGAEGEEPQAPASIARRIVRVAFMVVPKRCLSREELVCKLPMISERKWLGTAYDCPIGDGRYVNMGDYSGVVSSQTNVRRGNAKLLRGPRHRSAEIRRRFP